MPLNPGHQALAHVLRHLDQNFNLAASVPADEALQPAALELWLSLAESPSIIDATVLATTSRLQAVNAVPEAFVANTSQHGVLLSQFPFSFRIVKLLEAGETRAAVEARRLTADSNTSLYDVLHGAAETIFPHELVAKFAHYAGEEQRAYLYDFVCLATPPFPGVAVELQVELYAKVFRVAHPRGLASPFAIHALAWRNEMRLVTLCSFFSTNQISADIKTSLMDCLQCVPAADAAAPTTESAMTERLGALDLQLSQVVCVMLQESLQVRDVSEAGCYADFATHPPRINSSYVCTRAWVCVDDTSGLCELDECAAHAADGLGG